MAGAGYKLFNTGDVLTAQQVNEYLMQQTTMVFASAAARTSALSGVLAEGMVSYLRDTNTLEVYDGSAWIGATGDITGLTAGTGISISSATGPVPTITNSVATTFDALGDLVVGTGADTFAKLSVGASGSTIVADSSASTGLRWQTGNGLAQGAINGGMDIWQRGTSFTNGGQFTADRWYFDISASTVTSTRESTVVPAGFQYSWKINKSAGSSSATAIQQVIETGNAIQYAGKTVALSVYFAADASTSFSPGLDWSSTVDNARSGSWTSITPTVDGTTTVSTTTFVRITSTFAVPSTAKSLRINFAPTLASGVNIYLTGVQLELGSVATPFRKAGGTLAGELAACQRYYYRYTPTTSYDTIAAFGLASSTTRAWPLMNLPVTMRTIPSSVEYSTTYSLYSLTDINGEVVSTAIAIDAASSSTQYIQLIIDVASGLTANRMYKLISASGASSGGGYIGVSAEL